MTVYLYSVRGTPMKIVVLHGEIVQDAPEDEVDGWIQAQAVRQALAELGYDASPMAFSEDIEANVNALMSHRPELVFNLVETLGGTGRWIHVAPVILDRLGIAYTGCGAQSLLVSSNKLLAKQRLFQAGIPTPELVTQEDISSVNGSGPVQCMIKSVWEHGSVGLYDDAVLQVAHPKELMEAMETRRMQMGGECFAERYIDGREFNVSMLAMPCDESVQILPVAEIRFMEYPENRHRIVCYKAKWDEDSFEYHHTRRSFDQAPGDQELIERMKNLALSCWKLFDLQGYGRVDFRLDGEGNPWVLEINSNPCISPDSGFVAAAEAAGMTYRDIIERIVDDVLGRRDREDFSSVLVQKWVTNASQRLALS